LTQAAISADDGFRNNEYLRIDGGEAVLKRLRREARTSWAPSDSS
jgi:hypothetical protein